MNVPEYLRTLVELFQMIEQTAKACGISVEHDGLDVRRMRDIAERWEHMQEALEYADKHLFEGGVRDALDMAKEPVEEVEKQ
jgi:hypothetical protein